MAGTGETNWTLPQTLSASSMKCVCPKVRRVGSKAAVLVLVWTYLVYVSCASIVYYGTFAQLHVVHTRASTIGYGIVALLGPVAGLVASAYFGRYKIMYASLWFIWSGVTVIAIALVILQIIPEAHNHWTYSGEVIAVVVYFFGLTAFAVNSIPFGLDQMPDASSEQITAFIHWYTWSALAGVLTAQLLYAVLFCWTSTQTSSLVMSVASEFVLTLALCSIFLLHGWLIIEPESKNPLKTIFKVLKFAAKHKRPVRRSAFTYWEPKIPSRIDLGKSKYGGPFTNEEVEDVKTCLRMVVVLAVSSIAASSFAAYLFSSLTIAPKMLQYDPNSCHPRLLHALEVFVSCVVLSLPVYDMAIRPIFNTCRPSTLKRVGLAKVLFVCVSLTALAVSVVWYITESPDQCPLVSGTRLSPLFKHYEWIVIPNNAAISIFLFFFFTAMLEFVCAQAPYNMRGLLVGMLPSMVELSALLGALVHSIWRRAYKHQGSSGSMCGIWFYLFTTITATLGCVIWFVAAKWYKKRERDEPEMCRIFAENYYDH